MWLRELRLENLRIFETLELNFTPGLNLLTGANGVGKTSILEAVYLLSHGRSFRSFNRDVLVRQDSESLAVFGKISTESGTIRRLGLQRMLGGEWQAKVDGCVSPTITELLHTCAVVCFEPGSHELIAGASERRRKLLDWGLFHVEPNFLPVWRRYQRALKQRNRLLKQEVSSSELYPWDMELAESAESVTHLRVAYIAKFIPRLIEITESLLSELGTTSLKFDRGWAADQSLDSALQKQHTRDLARGHTSLGAHRADWCLHFSKLTQREHLSRGQQKLCALACMLAQAMVFRDQCSEWPIICLDDFASELDLQHQKVLIDLLSDNKAQVLITGTEISSNLSLHGLQLTRFHVERDRSITLVQ